MGRGVGLLRRAVSRGLRRFVWRAVGFLSVDFVVVGVRGAYWRSRQEGGGIGGLRLPLGVVAVSRLGGIVRGRSLRVWVMSGILVLAYNSKTCSLEASGSLMTYLGIFCV